MFLKGQKVRCIVNPYTPMLQRPAVGDVGIITAGGDHIVSVKFGSTSFRAWLVVDGHGRTTIELLPQTRVL